MPLIKRVVPVGPQHTWEVVNDRISIIRQALKRPGKGGRASKIRALYVATATYAQALQVSKVLGHRLKAGTGRVEIREAKRSIGWEYEVKFQGDFSEEAIAQIEASLESSFPSDWTMKKEIVARYYFPGTSRQLTAANGGGYGFTNKITKGDRRSRALFA